MTETFDSLPEDVRLAVSAACEKKAEDSVLIDVRPFVSFTNFFLICSGNSERQVQVIADHIEATLKKIKTRAYSIEGYRSANWVLMDYADFIVHIFKPEPRAFYNLEGLWHDGVRVEIPENMNRQDGPAS
jgi:ribosome-associated protein